MSESERQQALQHWLGVAEIAAECGGVRRAVVYGWIASGQLRAQDFRGANATRSRWRSKPEWVAEFKAQRSNVDDAA